LIKFYKIRKLGERKGDYVEKLSIKLNAEGYDIFGQALKLFF